MTTNEAVKEEVEAYKVYVGPELQKQRIEALQKKLKQSQHLDGIIGVYSVIDQES